MLKCHAQNTFGENDHWAASLKEMNNEAFENLSKPYGYVIFYIIWGKTECFKNDSLVL